MSIGQTLSAARKAAGLSIEDVSAKSRLRASVIRSIEEDDFAPCGGDFYAKGHIRTFAGIVGANPTELVAEYDATMAAVDETPLSGQLIDSGATASSIARQTDRRAPRWGATAAGAALVVVIVAVSVQLFGGHKNPASTRAAGTLPVSSAGATSLATTVAAPSPKTSGAPSTAQSPVPLGSGPLDSPPVGSPPTGAVADAGVQIVLTVTTAKCWVSASASNGSVLYQGNLDPGQSKTFDDPQRVSLKLGNAPATDLNVNGVDIGAPSSKANVTSVSFGPGDPTQAQG